MKIKKIFSFVVLLSLLTPVLAIAGGGLSVLREAPKSSEVPRDNNSDSRETYGVVRDTREANSGSPAATLVPAHSITAQQFEIYSKINYINEYVNDQKNKWKYDANELANEKVSQSLNALVEAYAVASKSINDPEYEEVRTLAQKEFIEKLWMLKIHVLISVAADLMDASDAYVEQEARGTIKRRPLPYMEAANYQKQVIERLDAIQARHKGVFISQEEKQEYQQNLQNYLNVAKNLRLHPAGLSLMDGAYRDRFFPGLSHEIHVPDFNESNASTDASIEASDTL